MGGRQGARPTLRLRTRPPAAAAARPSASLPEPKDEPAAFPTLNMSAVTSGTIGYPRIGAARELKKGLEGYWAGVVSEAALLSVNEAIADQSVADQIGAGVGLIGVGDQTLFDHVNDWTHRFGCAAPRFAAVLPDPAAGMDRYFAACRGVPGAPALDLNKFLGTNYHYLVPEFGPETRPAEEPDFGDFVKMIHAAQTRQGSGADRVAPIVVGPVTLCTLAKYTGDATAAGMVQRLVPSYVQLLQKLASLGVPEVQMHEPCLVVEEASTYQAMFESAYGAFAAAAGVPPLHLVTYFDDVAPSVLAWTLRLPGVSALSLDFTRGDNLASLRACRFPAGMALGAGVVDGRSVWADAGTAAALLGEIRLIVGDKVPLRVQPSCSLQYVPLDLEAEVELPGEIKGKLAFARQKLAIITALAAGAVKPAAPAVAAAKTVQQAVESTIEEALFVRTPNFAERRPLQFSVPGGLVTNTIGSFPQTAEIRRLRLRHKRGLITDEALHAGIDAYISYAIGAQEALDLDVLVHGEPERSDMVEFFGQHLRGMAFTLHGWVQSYGSRYVRPPVIVGDISRESAMTVREFKVAQALTAKPVKGMLTAATTIINWSFPRKDVPLSVQAYQIGLALRGEVLDLEAAGCRIIQVDDPAIREGLPLKRKNWDAYLNWAVRAFRLSTSGVRAETQIYSHLCYASFEDILPALDAMDVDVLTVENSRSNDEMLRAFTAYGYARDIGPGIWDVHTQVVATAEQMAARIKMFADAGIPMTALVANPDCGLKTRQWSEVIPSLRNMVAAAKAARAAAVAV
jgi:5-methyltetrahydropteroyltriglutamate--homocysteine methyltransferase